MWKKQTGSRFLYKTFLIFQFLLLLPLWWILSICQRSFRKFFKCSLVWKIRKRDEHRYQNEPWKCWKAFVTFCQKVHPGFWVPAYAGMTKPQKMKIAIKREGRGNKNIAKWACWCASDRAIFLLTMRFDFWEWFYNKNPLYKRIQTL